MIRPLDLGDAATVRALVTLQRAAYAVEAQLLGDGRIPPLHETVEDLRAAGLTWVGALSEWALVGALASIETHDLVDVLRLVVAPEAHRRGIGATLVTDVLRRGGGRRTVVATGRANLPARALYERHGFRLLGEREVVPGLWVTRYEHPG